MRVLYIDCDSLRPDHLGCYGYHRATSPNVDRMALEGVRFTQCYVSDAPCVPSRTSLFYGRHGISTGVVGHSGTAAKMRYPGDGHVTDPRRLTLPMQLSRHASIHTATLSTFGARHLAWYFYAGWDEIQKLSNRGGNEIATEVEAAGLKWIKDNAERDDWFVHLNFWDPHTPYRTPVEYGFPFADDPAPDWPTDEVIAKQNESYGPTGARDLTAIMGKTPRTPESISDRDGFKTWIDGYDTGIKYFDDSLGRVLNGLADVGVLDDTAIIISADHGENQGELNLYGSHLTADAITCRVPLIVRWPGKDAGTVVDTPIYHFDMGPTLCEMFEIDPPELWDGRSYAPALEGRELEARPYLVLGQGAWCVQRAVLAEGRIYIRTLHPALDPMPDEMLFDLADDPHEERNLVESDPDSAGRMSRLLAEWWHDKAPAGGQDPLLHIIREGGALYARNAKDMYCKMLRESGRSWAADEIDNRGFKPVIDPFDMARY